MSNFQSEYLQHNEDLKQVSYISFNSFFFFNQIHIEILYMFRTIIN